MMSGGIRQFRKDIYSQPERLRKVDISKFVKVRKGLFTGAGDSYACAILIEYLSHHEIHAYHPSDILLTPKMMIGHDLFIISASGKTRSNIQVAETARNLKVNATLITANPMSKLAGLCKHVLNLGYLRSVPSSLDFTSAVIACMSLIGAEVDLDRLGRIIDDARKMVNSLSINYSKSFKSVIFLGNGFLFPVGIYAALKIYEVLGAKSFAYILDEYYHSPIFSLDKSDLVFILDHGSTSDPGPADFHHRLKKMHFRSYYLRPNSNQSQFEQVMFSIFFVQLLALTFAENLGIKECYYLSNKRMLSLSSSLIY